MRLAGWLFVAALSSSSAPANAEFYSGNELHLLCSSANGQEQVLCMGFVSGVFDTMRSLGIKCPNVEHVTVGQSVDVVKNYLTANPSIRHFTATRLVMLALNQAFSCRDPAGSPTR